MYNESVPNRSSPPAILLRESYRKDGRVKKRTLANLSKLPATAIETLRRVLGGEKLVSLRLAGETPMNTGRKRVARVEVPRRLASTVTPSVSGRSPAAPSERSCRV